MEIMKIGDMDNSDGTLECANRVYDVKGLCPTIPTAAGGGHLPKIIVAMRGRNPDKPTSRNSGEATEQRLEPNQQGLCGTITTVQKDNLVLTKTKQSEDKYKIRRLTPRESWRLMGFSDEDFEKAAQVNSNTQLYKQAGNSIVKQVLMAIFTKLGA